MFEVTNWPLDYKNKKGVNKLYLLKFESIIYRKMQQLERQSGTGQSYQTPPRKDKSRINALNSKGKLVPHRIEQNFKKPQFVQTPSTGQLSSNYDAVLVKEHKLLKSQTYNVTNSNSKKQENNTNRSINYQTSNAKLKIRLFKQNTHKLNLQVNTPIQSDFQASKSKSKSKKGLSLLKNLIQTPILSQEMPFQKSLFKQDIALQQPSIQMPIKQPYLTSKIHQNLKDQKLSQFGLVKQSDFILNFLNREVQTSYCKRFLIKIYGSVIEDWKVTKFGLSRIMLEEGLISDMIKERHLVHKIWFQICELISQPNAGNIDMGIVFAFFASVMGYPIEEISLFNQLEQIFFRKNYSEVQLQKQVYKYFNKSKVMFNIKRLSTAKKL